MTKLTGTRACCVDSETVQGWQTCGVIIAPTPQIVRVAARPEGSSPGLSRRAAMSLALVPGQTAQTVTPSGAPATVGGVLQPPPDIKSIIDKTAQFVARNGPEFEQRILCAMLNPQAFPQPQTPVLTLARTRRPPRAALNTQLAVG